MVHIVDLFELAEKMLRLWNVDVLENWKKVYLASLRALAHSPSFPKMSSRALSLALILSEKSQPISSRRVSVYLLSKLSFCIEKMASFEQ